MEDRELWVPPAAWSNSWWKEENKIKRCQQQLQTRVQLGASWQPLPFPQQPIRIIVKLVKNQHMSNFEQIFSSASKYKNTVWKNTNNSLIVAPSLYNIKHSLNLLQL